MNKKLIYRVLAVSLALNMFLVGFVVAKGLKSSRHGGTHASMRAEGRGRGGGPFKIWQVLKESQKPELRQRMKRELKSMRPEREALHGAQRQVETAFGAEPFQAEALTQALLTLRTETQKNQARMHSLMVDIAKQLSPEERKRLAAANRRGGRSGRPGPGGSNQRRPRESE